ncbi:isochorismatase family protein [Azospirillum doebereinerae]
MSDLSIYDRQEFGKTLGFGRKTALLVIDFQNGFTRDDAFGGYNINDAIAATAELLGHARAAAMPIAHACFIAPDAVGGIGPFGEKIPNLLKLTADAADTAFVPAVAPRAGEFIVRKQHASAFFGTSLSSWLRANGVDTLLVTGCTTSGCVRASVIDASAHGLRPIIVEDCVGDRAEAPHTANLFDMRQKYADVLSLEAVIGHIGVQKAA